MHIILGEENARQLTNKYTLLELDLIRMEPDADALQAYCVLENIPAEDVLRLDEYSRLHHLAKRQTGQGRPGPPKKLRTPAPIPRKNS